MSFYFYETEYLVGNTVRVRTYEDNEYVGKIMDICEYDDHYHSAPVISMLLKTDDDYVELDDWEITDMWFISA